MKLFIICLLFVPARFYCCLTSEEIRGLNCEIQKFRNLLEEENIEDIFTTFMKEEILENFSDHLQDIKDKNYKNIKADRISYLGARWGEVIRARFGDLIVDSIVIDISEEMSYWFNIREDEAMYHWGVEDRMVYKAKVAVGNEQMGRGTIMGEFVIGRKVRKPDILWKKRDLTIPYGHLFNSFGTRKLELWRDGEYTCYACHGTNDTTAIGKHISLGCIRFHNKDVIILYELVKEKRTKVVIVE